MLPDQKKNEFKILINSLDTQNQGMEKEKFNCLNSLNHHCMYLIDVKITIFIQSYH